MIRVNWTAFTLSVAAFLCALPFGSAASDRVVLVLLLPG